jgi:hypothetical protein
MNQPLGYSEEVRRECLKMYVNGMGFRGIQRVKDVHHSWQKYSHLLHDMGGVKSLPLHFYFEPIDPS